MIDRLVIKKLRRKDIWQRIFYERLTEPMHLNVLSAFVAAFGSFRWKVAFDLVVRPQHAFSILKCADEAVRLGIRKVTLLEFGVASGAGLMNICKIADKATSITGVQFDIVGFDTGSGLPPPQSYRDHPDLYQAGDYPMDQRLTHTLPGNARVVLGDVTQTVPQFLSEIDPAVPVGFISFDLDYYTSTKEAIRILEGQPQQYLPRTLIYLDDVQLDSHNSWCGPLLAIHEFNERHELRKIEHHPFLSDQRIFRNARWIKQIFTLHVLDHATRSTAVPERRSTYAAENPYFMARASNRRAALRADAPKPP